MREIARLVRLHGGGRMLVAAIRFQCDDSARSEASSRYAATHRQPPAAIRIGSVVMPREIGKVGCVIVLVSRKYKSDDSSRTIKNQTVAAAMKRSSIRRTRRGM